MVSTPSTSSATHAMGIDVGGTTIRAALVNREHIVVNSSLCGTPKQLGRFVDWITTNYRTWSLSNDVRFPIGLALPGVVDSTKGELIRSINLPWLEDQPIVDQLESELGQRPVLMTDAQASTWGEYVSFGSPAQPFAHLRLGTGVACGIIVYGAMIPTDPARRTHLPFLVVDEREDATLCPCGLRGCLETFAGGDAISRRARDMGFRDLAELNRGCLSNYEAAVRIVDQAAIAVCRAIDNLVAKFGIVTVVVGGGVFTAVPKLFLRIQEAVAKSAHPALSVQLSRLGDEAGVIGAAQLAFRIPSPPKGPSH